MLRRTLQRYVEIQPVATPGASAAAYVPLVFFSRALSFVRLLIVGRLLGEAGKSEFGLYQPAQELMNWVVPIVLFGLADVAERYASRKEKDGQLGFWLRRQYLRLALTGGAVAVLLIAASPWLARSVLQLSGSETTRGIILIATSAATMLALAFYQHLASVLRGMRAYAASAGMEMLCAVLLLCFSTIAAWRGGAISLVIAYGAAVLIPLLIYSWKLQRHIRAHAVPAHVSTTPSSDNFTRFGAWTFLRLLLMMTFSAISIIGVGHLASSSAHTVTADYAMPYRIAQLLAYVAITLWASSYGIAASAWSHHQIHRAHVQLFRVGKFGAVALTLLAVGLLITRGIFASIEWQYADAINSLLPPLLAIFVWYGLLAFCSTYADLHESPHRGALLWAVAVAIQIAFLLFSDSASDPRQAMILACAFGVGIALLVIAPILFWHPFRFSGTVVPIAILAVTPISLFAPTWVVDWIAAPLMLSAIAFLYVARLLIRPVDRRAWRRWRAKSLAETVA